MSTPEDFLKWLNTFIHSFTHWPA